MDECYIIKDMSIVLFDSFHFSFLLKRRGLRTVSLEADGASIPGTAGSERQHV